ncbi:MAG: hypothetical protein ACE5IF_06240, partial [Candidatus Bathyarchaeia archaeon]
EELAVESSPTAPPTSAAPTVGLAEPRLAEKSAPATSFDADLAEETTKPERIRESVQLEDAAIDRTAQISRVFFYVGTLLLGSFLGFLLYSYFRRG